MSILDKNKIFFGLLHYIFSEQKNVDWALKTSLVNYTGINATVNNKKYKQDSVISDVIDYIYQIKPYHVEFEQFIEKYSSQRDEVNVSGAKEQEQNNITMYIRYDAVTSKVDEQGDMNYIEYMDTHMANRLYYYKTKNLDDINDYLNCHFKGITVNGSTFNVDKSGYDAFLYDSTLYDAPTITNDYCLINTKEDLDHPYVKKFVNVGMQSFKLESETVIQNQLTKVISIYNGVEKEITDYSIENNILTLFYKIRYLEKLIVTETQDDKQQSFVFVGHPFNPMLSNTGNKEFKEYGEEYFPIPENSFESNKITVHIEYPDGTRDFAEQYTVKTVPITNWEVIDNKIYIPFDKENNCYFDKRIKENGHIVVTTIDYYYIYDKIYTWEDRYGQSNNVVNLDGSKFLRPYYETERPSELCVSKPLTYYMLYELDKSEKPKQLYGCDYKDYQYKTQFNKHNTTFLTHDINLGDNEIYVDDITKLTLPQKESDNSITPGRILVNSEIIEFYEVDIDNKILKTLRRAALGSYFCEQHKTNDVVLDFNVERQKDYSTKALSISTFMTENSENKFLIPGVINDYDDIYIMKKPLIKLLTDIKFNSTYFDISSDNVFKPGNVILTVPTNNINIQSNQKMNLIIGGITNIISFSKNIKDITSLSQYLIQETKLLTDVKIVQDGNNIIFVANNGKDIKLSNDTDSYVLQEMIGSYIIGSNTFTTDSLPIMKDGSNGLRINNQNVIWGSDKNSLGYMKEHPERGSLQDAIDTVNNNVALKTVVKALNIDGKFALIPLQNIDIVIQNLTNNETPEDNINILGISNMLKDNEIYTDNLIEIYASKPNKKGYIFINDDKIFYENIQQRNKTTYRISNFYIEKEYTKDNSVIYSQNPIVLTKDDYKIIEVEETYNRDKTSESETILVNYAILKEQPQNGEIIIVSNNK